MPPNLAQDLEAQRGLPGAGGTHLSPSASLLLAGLVDWAVSKSPRRWVSLMELTLRSSPGSSFSQAQNSPARGEVAREEGF